MSIICGEPLQVLQENLQTCRALVRLSSFADIQSLIERSRLRDFLQQVADALPLLPGPTDLTPAPRRLMAFFDKEICPEIAKRESQISKLCLPHVLVFAVLSLNEFLLAQLGISEKTSKSIQYAAAVEFVTQPEFVIENGFDNPSLAERIRSISTIARIVLQTGCKFEQIPLPGKGRGNARTKNREITLTRKQIDSYLDAIEEFAKEMGKVCPRKAIQGRKANGQLRSRW